jgi:hypothetical protein
MICANGMACAFPDSWLVDGTRTRTSTPSLTAHPLLLYLLDLRLEPATTGPTSSR